eukprot:scaffold43882_cov49-Phaeocystis_antarctica.AAC.1
MQHGHRCCRLHQQHGPPILTTLCRQHFADNTLPTTLCGQHLTDNNRGPLGLCGNNGFYSHTRSSGTSDRGVGDPGRWVG